MLRLLAEPHARRCEVSARREPVAVINRGEVGRFLRILAREALYRVAIGLGLLGALELLHFTLGGGA